MYRTFTSKVAFLFVFVCISAGCDPWFAYSPYEAQVADAYLNTTVKNLELINAMDRNDGAPFKVALLSDPHYHYGKLADAVRHINAQGVYSFAIVAGDLTENGLKQEFVYFHETMTDLMYSITSSSYCLTTTQLRAAKSRTSNGWRKNS